jgi:hypothetical protein
VFNVDPPQAAASFKRLAILDADIACFGHGEPITQGAAARVPGLLVAALRRGMVRFVARCRS